ncbi:SET domain-containing protein [Patescibacteria group bacterium]|nr:MAG: SET domain-containing protein [Patescibacteria group bacterium]
MKKGITVRRSKIIGKGVFAVRNFKKGEVVLQYNPLILKKVEADSVPEKEKHYLWHVGKNKYFLMQPPERYVNHSCDPNTSVRKNADVARRNIKIGEEITSNYARAKGGNRVGFICKCGSKNCKKIVKVR